jgi:hypothetical protein
MRWKLLVLALVFPCAAACSDADYVGEEYPRVVEADEVRTVLALPAGTRIIGAVAGSCTSERSDHDALLAEFVDPDCSVEVVERRLARKAAQKGGEYLVRLECDEDKYVERELEEVDNHRVLVTIVTTTVDCVARVARSWCHERTDMAC